MNIEEIKDSLQRNNFTGLRARLDSAIEFIDSQQAEIEALKQQLVTTSSEAKLNYSKGHEDGRQLGMKQERALWELATSTQEIMDTHPVKELTEDMLWEFAEKFLDTDAPWGEANVTGIGHFIEAILRKAQEK
jgi:FtsZ-binding cell division protein ZapB